MSARQNKSIFGRQMGWVDYKNTLNATEKFNSKLKKNNYIASILELVYRNGILMETA